MEAQLEVEVSGWLDIVCGVDVGVDLYGAWLWRSVM